MFSSISEHFALQFFLNYILVPLFVGVVSAIVTTQIYNLRLSKARQDASQGIKGQYRQMVQSIDMLIFYLLHALPQSIFDEDQATYIELDETGFDLFKQKYEEHRVEITTLYSGITVLMNDYMNHKSTENYRVLIECAFTIHCILQFFETLIRYHSDRFITSPYMDTQSITETDLRELIVGIFGYRLMADWKIKDRKRLDKDLHGSEKSINNHYFDFAISFLKALGYYDEEKHTTDTHDDVFPIIFLPNAINLDASLAAALKDRETAQD